MVEATISRSRDTGRQVCCLRTVRATSRGLPPSEARYREAKISIGKASSKARDRVTRSSGLMVIKRLEEKHTGLVRRLQRGRVRTVPCISPVDVVGAWGCWKNRALGNGAER